jgi:2-polyprenyl-6-methoxyphenol hydroxylase-like FAD-dependent oxidoreductase
MSSRTSVLIVGAGPVGLLAALDLASRGVQTTVIDQNEEADTQSYAVVLHPRVLAILTELGVTAPLLWKGRSFRKVVVRADGERRAVLDLLPTTPDADGALTLPQSVLRTALETALRAKQVHVLYRHRLEAMEQDEHGVRAHIARTEAPRLQRAERSIAPERTELHADFLIGADGPRSVVRTALGIPLVVHAPTRSFAFFDVPSDPHAGAESELALWQGSSNAMYPLHGGAARYSFEVANGSPRAPGTDVFRKLIRERMPWHTVSDERVEWSGIAGFAGALATSFGRGRIWLAGDAAHATSPLGVQSLNVGLHEARLLARGVDDLRGGRDTASFTAAYDSGRQLEWRRLLGLEGPVSLGPKAPSWVREHLPKLLSSLPASGDDLDDLLDQLGCSVL